MKIFPMVNLSVEITPEQSKKLIAFLCNRSDGNDMDDIKEAVLNSIAAENVVNIYFLRKILFAQLVLSDDLSDQEKEFLKENVKQKGRDLSIYERSKNG